MKQSYPTGMVADHFKKPLTFEAYQGRLLVPDMVHVVMPNEKLMCGVCRAPIQFNVIPPQVECCGVTYLQRIHSYVIEAKPSEQ